MMLSCWQGMLVWKFFHKPGGLEQLIESIRKPCFFPRALEEGKETLSCRSTYGGALCQDSHLKACCPMCNVVVVGGMF